MLHHTALLHLKSFLASPRGYLAARRSHGNTSAAGRWTRPDSLQDLWNERTALMAGMIAPGSTVLEFGAGREYLRECLPAGCDYQPSDIVARSASTLVCDLNNGFPSLDKRWDVIVFSGVLEYIHDVPALLARVRAHGQRCVLSYATTDGLECMTTRLQSGWVNHFSRTQFERLLTAAGFEIAERTIWKGQVIYALV